MDLQPHRLLCTLQLPQDFVIRHGDLPISHHQNVRLHATIICCQQNLLMKAIQSTTTLGALETCLFPLVVLKAVQRHLQGAIHICAAPKRKAEKCQQLVKRSNPQVQGKLLHFARPPKGVQVTLAILAMCRSHALQCDCLQGMEHCFSALPCTPPFGTETSLESWLL